MKMTMKLSAVVFLSTVLFGAAGEVAAQTNALASSPARTNFPPPAERNPRVSEGTNPPPVSTNVLNSLGNTYGLGTNHWWTNVASLGSNRPPVSGTNSPVRGQLGPTGSPPRGLPTDVQVVVRQFQRQSALLAGQLNNASEAQRKQILQQLEVLREQLQNDVVAWRETAKQQDMQLQRQFNNPHPLGNNGTKGTPRRGID